MREAQMPMGGHHETSRGNNFDHADQHVGVGMLLGHGQE